MAFVVYNVDLNLGKVNIFLKKNTRKVITFCPDVSVVNIVGKKEISKSDRNDSESFEGYSSKENWGKITFSNYDLIPFQQISPLPLLNELLDNGGLQNNKWGLFSYITIYLWRDLWFVPNHLSSFRKLRSFGRMLPLVKNILFLFFSTNHTQPFNTLVGMNNCGRMDISFGFIWLFGGNTSKHAIRVYTTSLYFSQMINGNIHSLIYGRIFDS